MSRVIIATALLFCVLLTLSVPPAFATPAPAAAVEGPVDQAGWTSRKRVAALPNGVRLAYVELGNPAGRPVLLLHGFTDSSRVWTILAPYLSDHRVLILDQRGHGGSDAPACCYGTSDFAEDARLFLDAMHVERAAVVGHSLGSFVGQALAARHPERVERLALLGSTGLPPVRRGDWLWTNVMGMTAPVAENRRFLGEFSTGASPTPVDPDFVRHADREMAAVPLHVWRAVARELVDLPAGRHAPDVAAPVLILSAGADPIFTAEHHAALLAAYPRATAHVFPGLGHNFPVERPAEVAPVLVRFLADGRSGR
ncbi:MAG TPA: alpha/beta hydrolase [Allosphingosinicella sp.]|nr:alpha/beta hydrolase [Allosphingosinicella sp.]